MAKMEQPKPKPKKQRRGYEPHLVLVRVPPVLMKYMQDIKDDTGEPVPSQFLALAAGEHNVDATTFRKRGQPKKYTTLA